jgi:hypothetical protein
METTHELNKEDSLLTTLLEEGQTIHNASIVEFDFVPAYNSVQFEYVFASEEYPMYVHKAYNDVFGFWVNKKNTKPTNIALVPGTSTPVSINTVNNGNWDSFLYEIQPSTVNGKTNTIDNEDYFTPNPGPKGSSSTTKQKATEFNGYTTVLTAKMNIDNPCDTFHLRLAVGNAGTDGALGSGVFLKAHSFTVGTSLAVNASGKEEGDSIFINCDNNYIRIARPASDLTQVITLVYGGDGINGTDYTDMIGNPLPDTIHLSKSNNIRDIQFKAPEGATAGRYFTVGIQCECDPNGPLQDLHTVKILGATAMANVAVVQPCNPGEKGTITVTASGGSGKNYEYSMNDGQTWQTSNVFSNLDKGTYPIAVRSSLACTIARQNVEINTCRMTIPVNPHLRIMVH